eukprot:2032857-Rhodomonas_salina.1
MSTACESEWPKALAKSPPPSTIHVCSSRALPDTRNPPQMSCSPAAESTQGSSSVPSTTSSPSTSMFTPAATTTCSLLHAHNRIRLPNRQSSARPAVPVESGGADGPWMDSDGAVAVQHGAELVEQHRADVHAVAGSHLAQHLCTHHHPAHPHALIERKLACPDHAAAESFADLQDQEQLRGAGRRHLERRRLACHNASRRRYGVRAVMVGEPLPRSGQAPARTRCLPSEVAVQWEKGGGDEREASNQLVEGAAKEGVHGQSALDCVQHHLQWPPQLRLRLLDA